MDIINYLKYLKLINCNFLNENRLNTNHLLRLPNYENILYLKPGRFILDLSIRPYLLDFEKVGTETFLYLDVLLLPNLDYETSSEYNVKYTIFS